METNTNTETVQEETVKETQEQTQESTKDNNKPVEEFNKDTFFDSIRKASDRFTKNTALKQLKDKYNFTEEEADNLFNDFTASKTKVQDDLFKQVEELKSEIANYQNTIKNIHTDSAFNEICSKLDVKQELKKDLFHLVDIESCFDEKTKELNKEQLEKLMTEKVEAIPSFKNTKESLGFNVGAAVETEEKPKKVTSLEEMARKYLGF